MNAAETNTARVVEVLRLQARMADTVLRRNVDGITQTESLIQPRPGGNCLNWVVGHLVAIYERALPLLGQKSVMPEGSMDRYDRGSAPILDAAEARDFKDLMTAWDECFKRFDAGLAAINPATLDAVAPFSPSGNPNETVRSLLTTICFHQTYHAGQTGVLRRIVGKDGAIQ